MAGTARSGTTIPFGLAGPVFLALVLCALVPCVNLLVLSLTPPEGAGGGISFANFVALFDSNIGRQALARTIRISVIVTLVCIVAGYPIALFVAGTSPRWRALILAIIIFPFLISAVVRAFGWTVILGRKGLINEAILWLGLSDKPLALVQNEIGIVIGETHLLLPYMVLSLLAVLQRIDPRLIEAAKSLGATPPGVFWRIVVPMTLPGLLTGTLLVFSLAMTAFATPFLLGGGRSPILTTLLYQYAFGLYDWTKASTVGVVLLCLGALFVTIHRLASARGLRGHV